MGKKKVTKVSKGRALQGHGSLISSKVSKNTSRGALPDPSEEPEKGLLGRAELVDARRALATQVFTPEVTPHSLPTGLRLLRRPSGSMWGRNVLPPPKGCRLYSRRKQR